MRKPSLLVVFLTVFIDLIGFGIVLPLLPIYSEHFGASGLMVGVIMASLRILLGIPQPGTGAQLRPTNTGLTEWEHDPSLGRWTLHSFNETSHLLGLDRSA